MVRIIDALLLRDSDLATGSPQEQMRKQREAQREKIVRGIIAKWPEIPRARLVFSRYWVEDTETGNLYREGFGDPNYAANVCAHFIREDGSPGMLEPHDPPSRAAIEQRRAAREQRLAEERARRLEQRQRHVAELRER